MSQSQIEALDRVLDSLRNGQADPGQGEDYVFGLLAGLRAADWPDRAAGQRVGERVAATLGSRSRRWTSAAFLATAAVAATAAAVALVAIGAGQGGGQGGGRATRPLVFRSRFTATAIAAGTRAAPVQPRSRTWQLVSFLTGAGWQAGRVGASTGALSCPSAEICYLSAARPEPISGFDLPSPTYDILEVTKDGGASWSALSLPADISLFTPLRCPTSVTTCFAAGTDAGRYALFYTEDGGQSWSARPVPVPGVASSELACTSDRKCVALFQTSGWAPGYYGRANNSIVMVTSDGGRNWSAGPTAPHGQLPDYLTCDGSTCVLFDQLITEDNSQSVSGGGRQTVAPGNWIAWYSHDGGTTWQRGRHPGSVWTVATHDLPDPGTISCSDRLHCWAAMSDQIGQSGTATAFLATTDGGLSWTTQQLPVQRSRQFSPEAMSCPTARHCYAGGGDASGPVILTTSNGGATWSPVRLPVTPGGNAATTGLLPEVGLLSCGAATHCVAALLADGSAHSVPVYSLGARQGWLRNSADRRPSRPAICGSFLVRGRVYTGSKEHNIVMRQRAIQRGLRLNEYGLFKSDVETREPKLLVVCNTEDEIFQTLGLAYVPPELREDPGNLPPPKKTPCRDFSNGIN